MTSCDLDTSVPDWIIEHPETLVVFREYRNWMLKSSFSDFIGASMARATTL